MKKIAFLLLLLVSAGASGQRFYLEVTSASAREKKAVDSIGYVKIHPSPKAAQDQAKAFLEHTRKLGWLESEIVENKKTNDSTFHYVFTLGQRVEVIHIYIGINPEAKSLAFPNEKKDTLTLPFPETEAFLNSALNRLENYGYSLSKVKLIDLNRRGSAMAATLLIEPGQARQINDIVINGYDKFPEGHKRQVRRMYRNKVFNKETLAKIHADFEKFRFVSQSKYPEILFTKDTTKIFVYLEKAKANKFDGFIGFSNDESDDGSSKIRFNGYLDLLLANILNSGEQFSLYWKSDGKQQTTFNAGIELPYVFRSPIGLKASLNIFKQDSTFQNTKTAIALGYFFNYNTRLYLGYESTQSSDIQNQNTTAISDFDNQFFTSALEFTRFKPEDFLFPEKTTVLARAGVGQRDSKLLSDTQWLAEVNLSHNIYLDDKNIINLRSRNFYLKSDSYLVSELHRFGGINSVRGFNENSLQANLFTSLLTEYRYVFAPGLYMHTIVDYGYFRDETILDSGNQDNTLLGLGFGFGLLTKNGLFNLVYANGSTGDQTVKLSNSIVHISFKATF
ncbi:hypothetical protein [Flavobacterium longum]|uniref:hypothetical protein n=1 Tax=Flavobacterium longum TaxID=1299340 RepID=UPI0039E8F85A